MRSTSTLDSPMASDSRPAPKRRMNSICASRSWAWTKPSAKLASAMSAALMVTRPSPSRSTSTGALKPGRAMRPSICGSEPRSQT